jgi:hypothetical protein
MDIPTLDGEEWWESAAIDDTDCVINELISLVETCLRLEVNVVRANSLYNELSKFKFSNSASFDVDNWLRFCDELSCSILSKEAFVVEGDLKKFIQNYLPSKVKL